MKVSADLAVQTRLEAERETFALLLDLLEREQQALLSGDVDSLAALSQDKSKTVSELASLADQRSRHLALNFGVLDLSEMIRRFDSYSESAMLGRTWAQILDLAAKAKALNKINGALIEKRLARNRSALNVLRGSDASTYGHDGQTVESAGVRILGVG